MDISPMPFVFYALLGALLQVVFVGGDVIEIDTPTFTQPKNSTADIPIVGDILAGGGIILQIFATVWAVILIMVKLMSFAFFLGVLPSVWVMILVLPNVVGFALSIASLIRG